MKMFDIIFSFSYNCYMRIFFVADVNDCQMQYERVSAIYGDDHIISFVKNADKDVCKINCPAVVYYSGKIYDAFKPYCAEDDTLIVFASANADEYMLEEIKIKSKDNDIVYVRRHKENAFTRFMHKLYNVFVRLILSKRDSCASSKIIFLSANAMKEEMKNGAKFRFLLNPEMKTEEVIYTPGTKPIKVKKKWSKHCWISLGVFVGLIVLAVVLDLLVKMPFILQIAFDLCIVVSMFVFIACILKDHLDKRIEGI